MNVLSSPPSPTGKITSLDTSLLRASMKPGWEDLVRRCIKRFHLQNEGEMSFAKKHQQDGERDESRAPHPGGGGGTDAG